MIRKFLAITFILSIFCSYCLGQANLSEFSEKVFRAGPILGINLSQVDGDNDAGVHQAGLHAGLGAYVSLSSKIGFQLDILFSQKGSRYAREWHSAAGPYIMVYKLQTNNIEVPLALKYYLSEHIHIGAGASFNRLIGSNEEWRSLYGWKTLEAQQFPFEKNSWDGFVTASYRLAERWIAEVRYQRSITPIRKALNTHRDFSNGVAQLNNHFVIRLGFYL
jgi:hypothetical protein